MKKKILIISLSFLIILLSLLAACTAEHPSTPPNDDSVTTPSVDYSAQIRQLEEQIAALHKDQSLSKEEYQKELAALTKQLEALREEAEKPKEECLRNSSRGIRLRSWRRFRWSGCTRSGSR